MKISDNNFIQNSRGGASSNKFYLNDKSPLKNTKKFKNDLSQNLQTELVFYSVDTPIYKNTKNAIRIINQLDRILYKFISSNQSLDSSQINTIMNLLKKLELCNIDNEKIDEYINKIKEYIDTSEQMTPKQNTTHEYYYNIYKFKSKNKILSRMLSSLTFSLRELRPITEFDRALTHSTLVTDDSQVTDQQLIDQQLIETQQLTETQLIEKNKDTVFKLIEEIDNLLYQPVLLETKINEKLMLLEDLLSSSSDAEIRVYISNVRTYLTKYTKPSFITIKAYNNIYIDRVDYNKSYENRIIDRVYYNKSYKDRDDITIIVSDEIYSDDITIYKIKNNITEVNDNTYTEVHKKYLKYKNKYIKSKNQLTNVDLQIAHNPQQIAHNPQQIAHNPQQIALMREKYLKYKNKYIKSKNQ